MTTLDKPARRPANPLFSTGPTTKRPGWSLESLKDAALGRSHRSPPGAAKLRRAIDETRDLLEVPAGHRIAIVPASDTGAVEMALWSLLGARGVDCLAWESFGRGWLTDIVGQLRLDDVRTLEAGYGELPDLAAVDFSSDVVFTWNGTTSGVRVPDGEWIAESRQGLTICDATSAAFAQPLPFDRLDVTTFSWQKVMGGEAGFGMLILGPRAIERLESHKPAWPMPKIFRLTKGGRVMEELFSGATINTPSLLCVEDYLDALAWGRSIGGLQALMKRADSNAAAIADWVERNAWIDFLAADPATRSNTSVCLRFVDPAVTALDSAGQTAFAKSVVKSLASEGVAYDIEHYREAPPGLRIWCGATVETSDVEALLPWLEWAFATQGSQMKEVA